MKLNISTREKYTRESEEKGIFIILTQNFLCTQELGVSSFPSFKIFRTRREFSSGEQEKIWNLTR